MARRRSRPLRRRLMGGFLLAAFLTGLAGGGGILSLRQIRQRMQDTTERIGTNIDRQNGQINELMPLRSLVLMINSAASDKDLAEVDKRLGRLATLSSSDEADLFAMAKTLRDQKAAQLRSLAALSGLRKSIAAALEHSKAGTNTIADDVEFDSTMKIQDALAALKQNVQNASEAQTNADVEKVSQTAENAMASMKAALTLRSLFNEFNGLVKDMILADDPASVDYGKVQISTLFGNMKRALGLLPKSKSTEAISAALEKLHEQANATADAKNQVFASQAALIKTSSQIQSKMNSADASMLQASLALKKNTELTMDDSTRLTNRWSLILLVLVAGSFFIAMCVGFFISSSIGKRLSRVIESLTGSAQLLATASGEVSSMSHQLADASSKHAASLEEASSSLEEMASTTKQNAQSAGRADTLMKEVNEVASRANDTMTELISSMGEITNASEETSKIIKTIDEIAFQTNLLALNAAVEAARAGEAGAGFAVVADEVRNLAIRAAEAARHTASMIEGTIKKVKEGGELVSKTNEAFSEVTVSTRQVGELVGEISSASNEQALGIEQVNREVAQMETVMQQSTSISEESASASEEMSAQAGEMKYIVHDLLVMVDGNGGQLDSAEGSKEESEEKNAPSELMSPATL